MTPAGIEQLLAEIAELVTEGIAPQHRVVPGPPDAAAVWLFRNPDGREDVTVRLTWAEDALQLHVLAGGGWVTDLETTPAAVTSLATVTFRNVTPSMVAAAIIDVLL